MIFLTIHKIKNKINTFIILLKYKLMYGKNFVIGRRIFLRKGFIIIAEGKVKIGNECFFNNNCSLNSFELIEIGNKCIFGENVHIYDHNHIYNLNIPISESGFNTSPVYIGDNVWVSSNVTILKGVKIGNNCVIGAGVVVYKDVPDNYILINKQNVIIQKK